LENLEGIAQSIHFVAKDNSNDLPIGNLMVEGNFNGKAETLREKFREWACGLGAVEASGAMQETTLVRKGIYIGRRFSFLGFSLFWFVQEGRVKLFGPQGIEVDSQAILGFPEYRPGSSEDRSI
jgi:hypothetical protein